MNIKTLSFEDRDGDKYVFINDLGIILSNEDNKIEGLFKGEEEYTTESSDYYKYLKKSIIQFNSIEYSKKDHLNKECNQLVFKMTDACNMRCKYCIYSEHYPETKKYSNDKLCFETAKKGIDLFMKRYIETYELGGVRLKPLFTFFGGEPLIEFKLVKEIVNYIKEFYYEFEYKFGITTNGLILNQEISEFLIENKFFITVSLDGDERLNDRNRVDISNVGTYNRVINNIQKYFKGYPLLSLAACYDYETDLKYLAEFVENNSIIKDGWYPYVQRMTMINDVNTDYYHQFNKASIDKYIGTITQFREEYVENAILNKEQRLIVDTMIGTPLKLMYDRIKLINYHNNYDIFCSNCIPGQKLYLTANGGIYVCEKVLETDKFKIGDIVSGIDETKISDLIGEYNKDILIKCKECNISKLCGMCYAQIALENDNMVIPSESITCKSREKYLEQQLSDLVYIMKHNPNYFENILKRLDVNQDKIYRR